MNPWNSFYLTVDSLMMYTDQENGPGHMASIQVSLQELGWLVVLGLNATLTAEVISWRSVTHMCFLAFSPQY